MRKFQTLTSVSAMIAFAVFCQKGKQHIVKASFYKRLLRSIEEQLRVSVPTATPADISQEHLQSLSPQQIVSSYRTYLKKATAQKLSLFAKVNKENYLKQHLIIYALLSGGVALVPGIFYPALFGYTGLYIYSIMGRAIKLRFDYSLPLTFSYDFAAFQYLFGVGCASVLAAAAAHRGISVIKRMKKTKDLTIRKQ